MIQNTLSFKVLESYVRDDNIMGSMIRIDQNSMDALNISKSDMVEIRGKQRTIARVNVLYTSDYEKGIIRINQICRNNSGIAIGDVISIRKIKVVVAEKVLVKPLGITPPFEKYLVDTFGTSCSIDEFERFIASDLDGVPLTNGDHFIIQTMNTKTAFQVDDVEPAYDVLGTSKTVFHIKK